MPAREATPRWFALAGAAFLSLVLSPVSSEPCGLASPEVKAWIHGRKMTCGRAHSAVPSVFGPYSTCFGGRRNGGAPRALFNYGLLYSGKWSRRYCFDRPSTRRLSFQPQVHSDHAECGRCVPWNAPACLQSPTADRVYDMPPTTQPILSDEKPAKEDLVAVREGEPALGPRELPRDVRGGPR